MSVYLKFEKNIMKKHIANIVTSYRIIFSILMLFFSTFSPWFYIMYFLCGLTDMIDGTIARKTNSVSTFGARLDTIADFIFLSAALVKLLPVMNITGWLWIWILIIAAIKITNIISGFICKKRFVAEHTVMNKITGLLLFLTPFTLSFIELRCSAAVVCAVATFSAIQEGHYIRTGLEIE